MQAGNRVFDVRDLDGVSRDDSVVWRKESKEVRLPQSLKLRSRWKVEVDAGWTWGGGAMVGLLEP